jgi:hypothetical protein
MYSCAKHSKKDLDLQSLVVALVAAEGEYDYCRKI